MITKTISYSQLSGAIKAAFTDDKDLLSLYDPNVPVTSIEEIVSDILAKALSHGENVVYKQVFVNNQLSGYFFYKERMLISFGINKEYRKRQYTRDFFRTIKREMGSHLTCILWSKNVRAIKYLLKMGMQIGVKDFVFNGHLLTQLIN